MTPPPTDDPRDGNGTNPRPLAYRGVAYDSGTNFATGQGALSRNAWSSDAMRSDIAAIKERLNCNSVTVYGTDLGRLVETATAAIERGLHVWLQPQLVDRPHDDVLEHLAEVARLAESLRREGARINLVTGSAHIILTPGIVTGEVYHERMANIYADADHFLLRPTARVDVEEAAPRLNELLARMSKVARDRFQGRISYSSAPYEKVDWRPFDFVGIMHHYLPTYLPPKEHIALIQGYRVWNRPILIAGFGGATYREAEQKAFFFWDIVDRGQSPPRVLEGYERDETAQANYHRKMLELFRQAGAHGVSVTEFIHPTHPHSEDPRLDLDTASMCLVKTIRDDFDDPDSAYRWEPKESFHAIADFYARVAAGEEADRPKAGARP